jgi:excinuclease ABC subunit B
LRSETSLIQTVGRTARNVNGEVVLYADSVTPSMKRAIEETDRRRTLQLEFNRRNNITPKTIQKEIRAGIEEILKAHQVAYESVNLTEDEYRKGEIVRELEEQMLQASGALDFEKAAQIRDTIKQVAGETYFVDRKEKK